MAGSGPWITPKGKIQKNNGLQGFWIFPFGPPLLNNENKSCLNELKFWEASENHKSNICRNTNTYGYT